MPIVNQIPPQISRKSRGRPKNSTLENSLKLHDSDSDIEPFVTKRKFKQYSIDPLDTIRYDNVGHFPEVTHTRKRCKMCQSPIVTRCIKCNVNLCIMKERNCFIFYQTSQ